mgnify:CR=1 FL=1
MFAGSSKTTVYDDRLALIARSSSLRLWYRVRASVVKLWIDYYSSVQRTSEIIGNVGTIESKTFSLDTSSFLAFFFVCRFYVNLQSILSWQVTSKFDNCNSDWGYCSLAVLRFLDISGKVWSRKVRLGASGNGIIVYTTRMSFFCQASSIHFY